MADKHTPGPWYYSRWDESGRTTFYVSQQDGAAYTPNYSDVGHLVCQTVDAEKLAVQEANARLIAAAPELLAALESLIEDYGYGGVSVESLGNARSVIAKVRGDQ